MLCRRGLMSLGSRTCDASVSLKRNWTADPYSLGGYSVATPGAYEARLVLAQPTPPLFWAGEATVKHTWAATVHGALVSGQRAADEVQQFLLRPIL